MERGEPESISSRVNLAKQERERTKRLCELRHQTIRKAEFLSKKATIEYRDVYQLIREFFKEFLDKRYEFTMRELHAELRKVYISHTTRPVVTSVLQRMEAAEYATVQYSREDLVKLLADFRGVVDALVRIHTTQRSFVDRIKNFFFSEPDAQSVISELPVVEGNDTGRIRIYTLIERCYIALDKRNMYRAKVAYEVLLKEYDKLSADERATHYPVIHQTFLDLTARTKMQKQ